MKSVSFFGDEKFLFALNALQSQLRFVFNENGYKITAKKIDGDTLRVRTNENEALIEYPFDNSFVRGFTLALQHMGATADISVKLLFKEMGTMQDCSDGLMSVDGIKAFIRQSAIMGYTYLGLYTETTYEVENEPYFGYKTGRYTEQELSQIVEYGEKFHVEIVPFIQTLGHFKGLFRWPAYSDVYDIHDTLLVKYERTYELLENMFKSLRKSYKTTRINLGMDEAYFMGFGRYHWFIDEKDFDTASLFIGHLKRVLALAEKYGFTLPEIWFDNLFEIKFKGYINPPDWLFKDFEKEIVENFPKVTLRFWNYAIRDEKEFTRCCKQIYQLTDSISFASIAHGYTSFAPENYKTARLVETARNGCLQNGISDLVVTRWETINSPLSMLPAFYDYIERCSETSGYDKEERCKTLFGYTYQEFLKLDLPNKCSFDGKEDEGVGETNLPYYCLAEDLFFGIMEKHIPAQASEHFYACEKEMDLLSKKDSDFAFIFKFEKALCTTVAMKANLSSQVKKAYDKGDRSALREIVARLPALIKQIKIFHKEYREYWESYNKLVGFEIFDMRFGGMILRLETIESVLNEYINGKIQKIEDLEQVRLPIGKGCENKILCNNNWNEIACGRLTRL